MALTVPVDPTLTDIVTEGLRQAGTASPVATLIDRASTEWMKEIKAEIQLVASRHKQLQKQKVLLIDKAVRRYDLSILIPDFEYLIDTILMDGDLIDRGAIVGSGPNAITVAVDKRRDDNTWLGRDILFLGPNIGGEVRTIIGYNPSVGLIVWSISEPFSSNPPIGDLYLIDTKGTIQVKDPLDLMGDFFNYPSNRRFEIYGPDLWATFIPDQQYGVRVLYGANLTMLDLESPLLSSLYRTWNPIFVQGIYVRELRRKDDVRQASEYNKFVEMVKVLAQKTGVLGSVHSSHDY